ncbi:DMT family transporter [Nocardia sp. NPDC051321]|uniref:DMT family transporter n=1 Tax=Nocardia sp. NPDC051321 TaxID=3364323 RepID=UPI0037AE8BC4
MATDSPTDDGTPFVIVGVAFGALAVSSSSVFIALSKAPPEVSTFYRSALALPVLAAFATLEGRRNGWLTLRDWGSAVLCGMFFAADMLWWGAAIIEAGAGLSTVLVNVQVVVVPLIAYLVDRERPSRRLLFALPAMIGGLVAASGIVGQGATGPRPIIGAVHAIAAGICYSGFLFLLRRAGATRRTRQTYVVSVAIPAITALIAATSRAFPGPLQVDRATLGWLALTALTGQALGWLLFAIFAPKLSSAAGAAVLLVTPVGSLLLGAAILDERPSPIQLIGCVIVLIAGYEVAAHPRSPARHA